MRPIRVCVLVLFALWLAPCGRGQASHQAIVIEADLDGCYADCPPIPLPSYYVFCFRVDDKLVIGGHESWDFGLKKLASLEGKSLPLRYNESHVWVKLPSGWKVKLNRYPYEYSFRDMACRAEAQMRSFERGYTRPAPVPGEPATPVMHGKLVFGWALCSGSSKEGLTECTVWDLKGDIRQKGAYKPFVDSRMSAANSAWDDATDGAFKIIHLGNGWVLKLIDFTTE